MECLIYFGMTSMKEGTSAQLSGRGELHGGARVTTLVTLRKCTLGYKREIKTLKFVSASTKGFKGGLAWIKPSKKDMAVTFSYLWCGGAVGVSSGCPSPWSWCVCVRCVAPRVGVGGVGGFLRGVAAVRVRVCACGVWLVGWGVSYLGWFSSSVVGMVQQKKRSCRCVAEIRGMRDA